jgi:hypothetical protein
MFATPESDEPGPAPRRDPRSLARAGSAARWRGTNLTLGWRSAVTFRSGSPLCVIRGRLPAGVGRPQPPASSCITRVLRNVDVVPANDVGFPRLRMARPRPPRREHRRSSTVRLPHLRGRSVPGIEARGALACRPFRKWSARTARRTPRTQGCGHRTTRLVRVGGESLLAGDGFCMPTSVVVARIVQSGTSRMPGGPWRRRRKAGPAYPSRLIPGGPDPRRR